MADNLIQTLLRRKIDGTHARLTRLKLFEAFGVPAAIAFAALILVITGGFERLSPFLQALTFLIVIAVFALSVLRGWRNYRAPGKAEARDRLDASHPERPVSAYSDHPAKITAESRPYWDRHKDRLTAIVATLPLPKFADEWKKADPFYLRVISPAILILVCIFFQDGLTSRLNNAARTDIGALFGAQNIEITAWVTPPEHTGEAPVFLDSIGPQTSIPEGSELTIRVHGPGKPNIRRSELNDAPLRGPRSLGLDHADDGAWEFQMQVDGPQTIAVNYWGTRAQWDLNTQPDMPPQIEFGSDPGIGEDDALIFDWSASDEYGVIGVNLIISPTEASGLDANLTDRVSVETPSSSFREASDNASLDLTRHKWAGAEVELTLEAVDAIEQTGTSDTIVMRLPEKLFLEPLARASQEIRLEVIRETSPYETEAEDGPALEQDQMVGLGDRLDAAPDGLQRAALMLDAVTYRPDGYYQDLTVYFGLRRAHEMLRFADETADAEPLDDLLWSVALRAEYGTVADAARRLNAAREALENALRNGATEDEIRRLMQAFRDAAEDYIAARMAEALSNPNSGGQSGGPPPDDMLGGNDLADMLDALQDLTETGATDAARQLLSDVTNLLNNLDFQSGGEGGDMFGQQGEGGESENDAPEEEQRLQRTLDRLAELLEEQRRLNDETIQEQFGTNPDPNSGEGQEGESQSGQSGQSGESGENGQPGQGMPGGDGEPQTGPGGSGESPETRLAERQDQLIQDLEAFRRSEETGESFGSIGETDENLGSARQALEFAERALRNGDLGTAQRYQERAIREMRDAAGSLSENLDELRTQRLGERGENGSRDPLGRAGGGAQQNDGDGIEVPDVGERQRARDILDALRERLNQSTDPEEREYLERLLDRF